MNTYYDFHKNKNKLKEIDEINLELMKTAEMNTYVKATTEKPILGTYGLGPCLGLIISDEKNYCLGHIGTEYQDIILRMFKEMQTENIKITIIPGTLTTLSKINEIKNYIKLFPYNIECELKDLGAYTNKQCEGIEFAYDTRTNEFLKPDFDKYIEMKRGR